MTSHTGPCALRPTTNNTPAPELVTPEPVRRVVLLGVNYNIYCIAGKTFGKTLTVVGGVGAEAFWDEGGQAPHVEGP